MSDTASFKIPPSKVDAVGETWILHLPRFGEQGTHYHTYGLLTPYFRGLGEGRLMATRCVAPRCPISKGKGELDRKSTRLNSSHRL